MIRFILPLLLVCASSLLGAEEISVDVAVYGGVPCGIAAAIAAAREGASVVLIEPRKHVGGLSTSGINTAETEHMLKWTIGGFALEFYERLGKEFGTGKPEFYFTSGVAEKVYLAMLAEAKVPVRYGARVESVDKDQREGTRIKGIALNAESAAGARAQLLAAKVDESELPHILSITLSDGSTIKAKVFIDASYEGDLMARAKVPYAIGRESHDEFGEEAAGVRFDKTPRKAATVDENGKLLPGISAWAKDLKEGDAHRGTMNYNFRLCVTKDPAMMVPIPPPAHYDKARYRLLENWLRDKTARGEMVKLKGELIDFYNRRDGRTEMNNTQAAIYSLGYFGGQFDYPDADYATREKIIADHWDYTLGLIHFLKTDESVPPNVRAEMAEWGLHKGEFADNGNLPYQLYVREARRMRGAYVVKQQDVQDDRHKDDSIGLGSHFIDCHHVERVALSPTEFVNEGRIWRKGRVYQIPYRALTPRAQDCNNLLVPGAASYTHVAFCTLRLESTWMTVGQSAGVAAAMVAKSGVRVQDVPIDALQARLRELKQIIDFVPGQPELFPGGSGWAEF